MVEKEKRYSVNEVAEKSKTVVDTINTNIAENDPESTDSRIYLRSGSEDMNDLSEPHLLVFPNK